MHFLVDCGLPQGRKRALGRPRGQRGGWTKHRVPVTGTTGPRGLCLRDEAQQSTGKFLKHEQHAILATFLHLRKNCSHLQPIRGLFGSCCWQWSGNRPHYMTRMVSEAELQLFWWPWPRYDQNGNAEAPFKYFCGLHTSQMFPDKD